MNASSRFNRAVLLPSVALFIVLLIPPLVRLLVLSFADGLRVPELLPREWSRQA